MAAVLAIAAAVAPEPLRRPAPASRPCCSPPPCHAAMEPHSADAPRRLPHSLATRSCEAVWPEGAISCRRAASAPHLGALTRLAVGPCNPASRRRASSSRQVAHVAAAPLSRGPPVDLTCLDTGGSSLPEDQASGSSLLPLHQQLSATRAPRSALTTRSGIYFLPSSRFQDACTFVPRPPQLPAPNAAPQVRHCCSWPSCQLRVHGAGHRSNPTFIPPFSPHNHLKPPGGHPVAAAARPAQLHAGPSHAFCADAACGERCGAVATGTARWQPRWQQLSQLCVHQFFPGCQFAAGRPQLCEPLQEGVRSPLQRDALKWCPRPAL